MTLRVELVYDLDCPNVQEARRALLRAFADADIPPSWTEWDRKSPASPASTQLYGSPTILVNGRDVTGVERAEGADRCRIYQSDSGALRRVPPVSSIVAALRHEHALTPGAHIRRASGWRHFLASLPGVSAALLPVGGCPACWPVYAGVLGAVGLTFLLDSAYLLWINSALLGMACPDVGCPGRKGLRAARLGNRFDWHYLVLQVRSGVRPTCLRRPFWLRHRIPMEHVVEREHKLRPLSPMRSAGAG
jgi:hypothetical protein